MQENKRCLAITQEEWPLKKPFIISRGPARTVTKTITVHITEEQENSASTSRSTDRSTGRFTGRGEAVVSPRYGESDASVIDEIRQIQPMIEHGMNRADLQAALKPGSARNAVDNALWDLEAKLSGQNTGILSNLGWPSTISTVQTISILPPEDMHREAQTLAHFPILKVKANAELILERIKAVHNGAPKAKIIIDANESWNIEILNAVAHELSRYGVVMIEQPLPAGKDGSIAKYSGPLPIFADESCHTRSDLPSLLGKYQGINIKLDKTGGLSEGIELFKSATDMGFDIMVGCMLGTSLGMAPALMIAQHAKYVDVDAPALLAKDRANGLMITGGVVAAPNHHLWGG
jgi:L-alanine-DL-glutamate epimerase-like enolase superfamily enzyme